MWHSGHAVIKCGLIRLYTACPPRTLNGSLPGSKIHHMTCLLDLAQVHNLVINTFYFFETLTPVGPFIWPSHATHIGNERSLDAPMLDVLHHLNLQG